MASSKTCEFRNVGVVPKVDAGKRVKYMLSEELKKSIDRIWDTLWAGGLTNPLTDVEQITYLLFMKLIDDNQTREERNAAMLETTVANPVFKSGKWKPANAATAVAYEDLRWKNFCHFWMPPILI